MPPWITLPARLWYRADTFRLQAEDHQRTAVVHGANFATLGVEPARIDRTGTGSPQPAAADVRPPPAPRSSSNVPAVTMSRNVTSRRADTATAKVGHAERKPLDNE